MRELGQARDHLEWLERQGKYFQMARWLDSEPAMADAIKIEARSSFSCALETDRVFLKVFYKDGTILREVEASTGLLVSFSYKGGDEPRRVGEGFMEALREKLGDWLPGWDEGWHPVGSGLALDRQALRAALFTPQEIVEWDKARIARQAADPGRPGPKIRM